MADKNLLPHVCLRRFSPSAHSALNELVGRKPGLGRRVFTAFDPALNLPAFSAPAFRIEPLGKVLIRTGLLQGGALRIGVFGVIGRQTAMSCRSWLRSNFSRQALGDRDECLLFGDQFDEGTAANRPQAAGRDCFPISAVEASDGQAVCPVIGEQTHGCTSSSRPQPYVGFSPPLRTFNFTLTR